MWNFSFDDIARRAQEEAAKLAEQAQDAAANIQSPGLFNLDSMNPETAAPPTVSSTAAAPSALIGSSSLFSTSFSSTDVNASNIVPPQYDSSLDAGNAYHVASLVSDVASPRASAAQGPAVNNVSSEVEKKATVTKLSTVSSGDDFFDSWGDDEGTASSSHHDAAINAKSIGHENNLVDTKRADSVVPINLQTEDVIEIENKQFIANDDENAEPIDENAWDDDIDIPDETVESIGEPQRSPGEEAISKKADAESNALDETSLNHPNADDYSDNVHQENVDVDTEKNAWDDDFDVLVENNTEDKENIKAEGEFSAKDQVIDQERSSNGSDCNVSDDNAHQIDSQHQMSQEMVTRVEDTGSVIATENTPRERLSDVAAQESCTDKEVNITTESKSPQEDEIVAKTQFAVQSNETTEKEVYAVENDAQIQDLSCEGNLDTAEGDVNDDIFSSNECLSDHKSKKLPEKERPCPNKDDDNVESNPSVNVGTDHEVNGDSHNDVSTSSEDNPKGDNNVRDDIASNNVNDPWAEDDIYIAESKSDDPTANALDQSSQRNEGYSVEEAESPNGTANDATTSQDHFASLDENEGQLSESIEAHHSDALGVYHSTKRDDDCEQTEANQSEPHQTQGDSKLDSYHRDIEHGTTPSTIFDSARDKSFAAQSSQTVFDTPMSSLMFGWSSQNDDAPTSSAKQDASTNVTDSNAVVEEATSSTAFSTQPAPALGDVADDINHLYNDEALDDMYDDSEEEDSDIQASDSEEAKPVVDKPTIDGQTNEESNESNNSTSPEAMPQHVVDKFVKQLERMTESHQLEMDELHRTYKLEIAQLQKELEEERVEKKKAKARDVVAAQDKHLSQMRELEKTFNNNLQQKEQELEQVMKRNEGFALKMDSMKREVDGLLKLVDERDDEIARLKQGHGNTMLKVEGSIKDRQAELSRKDAEITDLKSSMSCLQAEFNSTTENYNTLKSRAKAVATELKDRRVEVRTLSSRNEELTITNASLETELANLKSQNDQQRRTISYKDKDIESLNDKIKSLSKEMDAKDSLLQDRSSVGEKAISSYKRKAQEALAAANSRLATANQAREEAESDAKAAKTASDDAVERARIAEAKRTDAERSASEAVTALEKEKSAHLQAVSEWQRTVDEMKDSIESIRIELTDTESSKDSLYAKLEQTNTRLNEQKELNDELHQKLFEAKDLCNSLQEEVHNLRDDAQRSSAAAFKRQKDESLNTDGEKNEGKTSTINQAESDGTIIMLQQELQGANDAISELKLALRMALLEKTETSTAEVTQSTTNHHKDSASGNDSTPLFFAIEKQNELNTARDEINRLANMLGDAESEKQEAFDAMEEMKRKMDDANARLKRYEKLGLKPNAPTRNSTSASGYASYRGMGHNGVSRENDSAVNLEYLKNVVLSYLNAKTLAERRKLVPVVATVLCLTPEEHEKAVRSVEESAGLTGVASSFWENLESKAHNLI